MNTNLTFPKKMKVLIRLNIKKIQFAHLKGTLDPGIQLGVNVAFPTHDGVYTDSNWGLQDASHPKDG